jgi:hypothetical protein
MSETYPDIVEKTFQEELSSFFDIFYPTGKPISRQRLRRSPFAVFKYSFMSHFLAAAAILARE